MTGSTETQSFDLDALRHQDFDDYVEDLLCDRERELARIEATPEPEPWLYEKEPMAPRLTAMISRLLARIDALADRRQYDPSHYRHSREWL
jgi:hypothetical protein